jgi:hypothetical protein
MNNGLVPIAVTLKQIRREITSHFLVRKRYESRFMRRAAIALERLRKPEADGVCRKVGRVLREQ